MENVEPNTCRKRQIRATATLKKIKTSVARVWRVRGAFGSTFSTISLKKRLWLEFGASEVLFARRFPLFFKNGDN